MKTMKHTIAKLFAAVAALAFMAGCSAVQEDNGVAGQREVKFTASVGSFQVKATDTAFENGDAIGLSATYPVSARNVRLTWQNGELIPETPVYWGAEQMVDQSALFYAYYPYDASLEVDRYIQFTVKEDQSTHDAYTASDLMTAAMYATPAEGTVNLNFIHRLSKLVITIDNTLDSDAIKEVHLGNVRLTAEINLTDNNDSGTYGEVGSIKAGEGTTADGLQAWSVIVPAQACTPQLKVVMASGKEYVYNCEYSVYFSPSRRMYANVIIDETTIATSFSATVYDWIDNGGFWFKQDNPAKFIGDWAVIGTIQGTNWDTDFPMDRTGDYTWSANIEYRYGDEFKLRMNGTWDINFGATYDIIMGDGWGTSAYEYGSNIRLEYEGIWNINLDVQDKYIWVYRVGDLPQEQDPDAIIHIDGDMSDWAEIKGLTDDTGYVYASFKATSDSQYLYLYSKRTMERFSDIWGGSGYFYYGFDTDNNPETGYGELWGNGPYEALLLVYPFGGSADAPEFMISGSNTASPDWCTASRILLEGAITDDGVEVEIRIPLQDLYLSAGMRVNIYAWGNKSATNFKETPLVITIGENGSVSCIADIIAAIPETATGSSTAVQFDVDIKNPVVVSYVNGKYIYVEDNTGAIVLYMENPGLAPGNTIKGKYQVKGYWYNGIPELVEFTPVDDYVLGQADVPVTVVGLEDLLANYDRYLLRMCRINDVTITDGIADGDRNGQISQGNDDIAVYAQLRNGLVLTQGAVGDIVCIPSMYKQDKQLLFWENDWFISSYSGWSMIGTIYGTAWDTDFELTVSEYNPAVQYIYINYNYGDSFKFRRNGDWLENFGLGDYWSPITASNGGEYGLVSGGGDIMLETSGRWLVTIDLENLLFKAVLLSDAGQTIEVRLSQEVLASLPGCDTPVTMADGVLTFTNSSDYGTTTVTELRIYKGKTMTLSVPEGYVITSIAMTCTASDTTKAGPGCFGAGAPEGYSFADKQGFWAGEANTLSFTATDNQVRITELTVTIAVL